MIHFTSTISELLSLREQTDNMIEALAKVQKKKDERHEEKIKRSILIQSKEKVKP